MTKTMSDRTLVDNILAVYREATREEVEAGLNWYQEAHNFADKLAQTYEFLPVTSAAVISVLSPLKSWEQNKRIAINAMELYGEGLLVDEFVSAIPCMSGPATKAYQLLFWDGLLNNDQIVKIIGGTKTKAFFNCIIDPDNRRFEDITIDTHAYNIAFGNSDYVYAGTSVSKGNAYRCKSAYNNAASMIPKYVTPLQLQAITWVTWKRLHGKKTK